MSDYKPQTGPSRVSNTVKQSPDDIVVTGQKNDDAKLRKTLERSLSQGNQAVYSRDVK